MYISRREFIKKTAIAGIALVGVPGLFSESLHTAKKAKPVKQVKHAVKICDGYACQDHGNEAIIKAFKKRVAMKSDSNVSKDKRYTLELTGCMGRCGEGPIVVIDNKVYVKMTPEKMTDAINRLESKR